MNPSKERSNTPKIVGTYVGKREERLGNSKGRKTFKNEMGFTFMVVELSLMAWKCNMSPFDQN